VQKMIRCEVALVDEVVMRDALILLERYVCVLRHADVASRLVTGQPAIAHVCLCQDRLLLHVLLRVPDILH
jgi:hypothetical protein